MNGEYQFEQKSAGVGIALRCAGMDALHACTCCGGLVVRASAPPCSLLCSSQPPAHPPCPCLRSVIFFTSLLLVGFGLPAFIKKPIAKGWAKCKQCCGLGRKPTKLPAPTTPAADAVADAATDVDAAVPAAPAS